MPTLVLIITLVAAGLWGAAGFLTNKKQIWLKIIFVSVFISYIPISLTLAGVKYDGLVEIWALSQLGFVAGSAGLIKEVSSSDGHSDRQNSQ